MPARIARVGIDETLVSMPLIGRPLARRNQLMGLCRGESLCLALSARLRRSRSVGQILRGLVLDRGVSGGQQITALAGEQGRALALFSRVRRGRLLLRKRIDGFSCRRELMAGFSGAGLGLDLGSGQRSGIRLAEACLKECNGQGCDGGAYN